MITGYNTDIEFQGVTYHVQTEDKGVDTPLILSLVYDRGTILASKRSPYEDLVKEGFNEKVLADRLQKQHKLMCAAVRAGRIEDLKRMTLKESSLKRQGLVAQKEVKQVPEKKSEIIPPPFIEETAREAKPTPTVENKTETEIPRPTEELIWDIPIDVIEEFIIDGVQIVEEEMILPAEAVEIVTDFAKMEQPSDDRLKIELMNETVFKGGERKTITILLRRGNQEKGLMGAQVVVKVIGSSFRPLIFHAKTDSNGVAIVHLQLPHFRAGRAAVLVKAMSGGEESELRRVVTQG
ncbi:MAG TPA: hypothetical protein PKE69_05745 [Pyrinomonadaceae bacterium]|nr:hypothetical protein [Pyrinomonadaceae bacterium]